MEGKTAGKKVATKGSDYQRRIMIAVGCTIEQAPLVEGYMRLDWGTLDALSSEQFDASARSCFSDVKTDPKAAHLNAASFGLVAP